MIIINSFSKVIFSRSAVCCLIWGGILVLPVLLVSCGKKQVIAEIPTATPPGPTDGKQDDGEENPDEEDPDITPPEGDFVIVGNGSGSLVIDGKDGRYSCNTAIKIKGGNYASIAIRNLSGEQGCPFVIANEGSVELSGSGRTMSLENLSYVNILGNSDPLVTYGFLFQNMNNEAIQMSGTINNFTLSDARFDGINAYAVIRYKPTLVYNGSDGSFIKNLRFLNLASENSGTLIRFEASEGNGTVIGLIRGIEIADTRFSNSPAVGSVIVLEKAEDVDIHHNIVENINSSNSNHNGVFYIQGNGRFYSNIVKHHQGNAIRAWIFSIGNTPKEMLIYNNIVVNSREYGAFELQAFPRDIVAGISTFANAKVFNNTCGDLRPKAGTFPAQVVDLYSLRGGACEIFNNVGYTFYRVGQNNTNYFWNELGDTSPSKHSNNLYYDNYQLAGIIDDSEFLLNAASPLKRAAVPFHLLTEDIYGNKRGDQPSVGAVE
ncbi:MAG: hypothetical protein EAS52_09695 [Parapedobacter sp.]|nr:MAG: hypothetical protein EAS52_09695 [Parapedobacter sp.]